MKDIKHEIDDLKQRVNKMSSDISDIKQLLESVTNIVKEDHVRINDISGFTNWYRIIRQDIQNVQSGVNRILHRTSFR